jgi:hypothetical protein
MNKIHGLVSGQYGIAVPLSIIDATGSAVDLTAYTAVVVKALSPDGQTLKSFTGAFVSSTGGRISFTPDSNTYFNRDGTWEGQVQFSDTGVFALTVPFEFIVERQL